MSHQKNFTVGEEAGELAVSLLQVFTSEQDERQVIVLSKAGQGWS